MPIAIWEHPSPKRSFEVHAPLLYEVNDAANVRLQADGDAHKRRIVVQFGSERNKQNIMYEEKYRKNDDFVSTSECSNKERQGGLVCSESQLH